MRRALPSERCFLDVAERQRTGGFPIIEDGEEVVFFFLGEGTQREVRLVRDFLPTSFFDPAWAQEGEAMERLFTTRAGRG